MTRRLNLSVQYACQGGKGALPDRAQIRAWVRAALDVDADTPRGGEITVRFVEPAEGAVLNRDYRGKDYATNVLSFPYANDAVVCGDLVICPAVAEREAAEQGKPLTAHLAHLVIHGLLHLQGYDHEAGARAAREMEERERALLAAFAYPDPYR